jgi:hypothetical protein
MPQMPSWSRLIPTLPWLFFLLFVAMALLWWRETFLLEGKVVFPLDDAYIHLQYARSIIQEHPYQYVAGQPPTSGATSLLYPYLLAAGSLLGFTQATLPNWAYWLGLSAFCLTALAAFPVWGKGNTPWQQLAISTATLIGAYAFWGQGILLFHAFSGMETIFFVAATAWTFWALHKPRPRWAMAFGLLAGLIRPEGVVIGGGAALYLFWTQPKRFSRLPLYALPFLVFLAQPLLNLALTGSATASGMHAKAILYNIPPYELGQLIGVWLANAMALWRELLGAQILISGPVLVGLIGLISQLYGAIKSKKRHHPYYIVPLWLLGQTLAIALLETWDWQYKRYQLGIFVVLLIIASSGLHQAICWMVGRYRHALAAIPPVAAVVGMILVFAPPLSSEQILRLNIVEVASSQQMMAAYTRENLPHSAFIGVHDIGVMAYMGNNSTYDLVGLTTPHAAAAWRHGPGAVFEAMRSSPHRPDYFAIYPDARGLTYFQRTGLFRELLASFLSTRPPVNVASATDSGQNIYRADWSTAARANNPQQTDILLSLAGLDLADSVNVANLQDERAHQYRWWNSPTPPAGFATEMFEQDYIACAALPCTVMDGGRLLSGGEEMIITLNANQALAWIIRVHPQKAGLVRAEMVPLAGGATISLAPRVIFAQPGQWLELSWFLPAEQILGGQYRVRVVADGLYMPYQHWFYQGTYAPAAPPTLPVLATFRQDSLSVKLWQADIRLNARTLTLEIAVGSTWEGPPNLGMGDGKLFLHLYDATGALREDAQLDTRLGEGALALANIPPEGLRQRLRLNIPAGVPPGVYQVAIGFYNPVTLVRYALNSTAALPDDRFLVGTINIE